MFLYKSCPRRSNMGPVCAKSLEHGDQCGHNQSGELCIDFTSFCLMLYIQMQLLLGLRSRRLQPFSWALLQPSATNWTSRCGLVGPMQTLERHKSFKFCCLWKGLSWRFNMPLYCVITMSTDSSTPMVHDSYPYCDAKILRLWWTIFSKAKVYKKPFSII